MKCFLIATLLLSLLAPSARGWAADSQKIAEVCAELQEARGTLRSPPKLKLIWDLLRLRLAPQSLVHAREIQIKTPDRLRTRPGGAAPGESENVIFSIDPPADLNPAELNAMKLRYAELTREIARALPRIQALAKAPTVEVCIARAGKSGLDIDAFLKAVAERDNLRLVDQLSEGKKADQVMAGVLGKLKLKWRVVHSTDLSAVHAALSDSGSKNIVILSHGLSGGKLVDSGFREYPRGFFTAISPHLGSISIFACHGEEIIKTYDLEKRLSAGLSESGTRRIFVSDGTRLAGMEDLVPTAAFRSFMRKVDRILSEASAEPAIGPPASEAGSCEAHFPGLAVRRGTLGFALNGEFIGTANAGSRDPGMQYPCSMLDRPRNILVIHGISLLGPTEVESPAFSAVVSQPGKKVVRDTLTHYKRPDGTYQGSRYDFGLE